MTDAVRTPTEAIVDTIARYGMLCDDGRFEEFAGLFAEDARFVVMGGVRQGRAEIAAFMAKAQPPEARGRHLPGPSVVELGPGDPTAAGATARAWTDYVFVDQAQRITSVGRYHDELLLGDDDRWRFALREIVFRGDEPTVAAPIAG